MNPDEIVKTLRGAVDIIDDCGGNLVVKALKGHITNAADLIESQQAQLAQQQSNEPLTLDELRGMDDEPIYIKHLMGEWHWDGWHILENCEEELIMHDGSILIDEDYGKTWLAYRCKP